jgi:hypothetical protein
MDIISNYSFNFFSIYTYNMSDKDTKFSERKITTGIGPTIDNFISSLLDKIDSSDFIEAMERKILDPIENYVSDKIRPYLYLVAFLYFIVILLLVIIIIMTIFILRKK